MTIKGVLATIAVSVTIFGVGYQLGQNSKLRSPASLASLASSPSSAPSALFTDSSATEFDEIKVEIPFSQFNKLNQIEGKKDQPKERQIYFFDTHELAFFDQGVILRARINESGEGDTTIKIKDLDDRDIDPELKSRDGFKCEWDRNLEPDSGTRNCSYTHDQQALDFARVLISKKNSVESLFTSKQLRFLESRRAIQPWQQVQALGPVSSSTWKVQAPFDPSLEMTIELWEISGAARILELSVRSPHGPVGSQTESTSKLFESWLKKSTIEHKTGSKGGVSKTEWVPRHFSQRHTQPGN